MYLTEKAKPVKDPKIDCLYKFYRKILNKAVILSRKTKGNIKAA